MGLTGNEGRGISDVLKVGKNGVMKEVAIVVEFVDGRWSSGHGGHEV